jgi:hypothetical protein
MKKLMIWGVIGMVLGIAAGTALGIRLTEWYFESPGAPVTCMPQIHSALHDLLEGQGIGALAGLVLFLIFGILWARRHHPVAAPPSQPGKAA